MQLPDPIWTLINLIQNLGFFIGLPLLFWAVYVLGKYQAFHKIRLSQIAPQLTDLEAYDEYARLSRLLAEDAK